MGLRNRGTGKGTKANDNLTPPPSPGRGNFKPKTNSPPPSPGGGSYFEHELTMAVTTRTAKLVSNFEYEFGGPVGALLTTICHADLLLAICRRLCLQPQDFVAL